MSQKGNFKEREEGSQGSAWRRVRLDVSAVEILGNKDNRSENCTSIRTKHRDRTRNLKTAANHPETAGAECPVVSAQSRPILTSTSPDTHPCPYPIPHKQAPHLLPGVQTRVLETSVHLWLTPQMVREARLAGVECPTPLRVSSPQSETHHLPLPLQSPQGSMNIAHHPCLSRRKCHISRRKSAIYLGCGAKCPWGCKGLLGMPVGVTEERSSDRKRRGKGAGRKGKCCSLGRARRCPLGVAPERPAFGSLPPAEFPGSKCPNLFRSLKRAAGHLELRVRPPGFSAWRVLGHPASCLSLTPPISVAELVEVEVVFCDSHPVI